MGDHGHCSNPHLSKVFLHCHNFLTLIIILNIFTEYLQKWISQNCWRLIFLFVSVQTPSVREHPLLLRWICGRDHDGHRFERKIISYPHNVWCQPPTTTLGFLVRQQGSKTAFSFPSSTSPTTSGALSSTTSDPTVAQGPERWVCERKVEDARPDLLRPDQMPRTGEHLLKLTSGCHPEQWTSLTCARSQRLSMHMLKVNIWPQCMWYFWLHMYLYWIDVSIESQ